MNGHQKSFLRSRANSLKPVFQIGKEATSENQMRDILAYLWKHELMKVSVLESCPMSKDELSIAFEEAGIVVVQTIGRTFVLYKENKDCVEHIILPRVSQ